MLFTYIDYKKPTISLSEQALAKINHLFFLGGQRLTVINDNNEAILKRKNLSWYLVALKVTAIVLLFFISIPLFAFGQLLSSRYSFAAQQQPTKEHALRNFPDNPFSQSMPFKPHEPHLDRVEVNQKLHQEEKEEQSAAFTISSEEAASEEQYAIDALCSRPIPDEIVEVTERSTAHSVLGASTPSCEGASSSSGIADESKTTAPSSLYVQLLKNPRYGRYQLTDWRISTWTQFNLKEHSSDREKFHLSLKRSVDNISNAFHALFPILNKYNVASFKTLNPENVDEVGANANGKEIVIYVDTEMRDPEIWSQQILPEILEAFKGVGVQCGRPSVGDLPLAGGEGFIYTRSPYNTLRAYISANKLELLGFSTFESATISDYPLLNISINQPPPVAREEIKLQAKQQLTEEISNERIELVKQTFNTILNENSFLLLITGDDLGSYLLYYSEINDLVKKYGENIGNFRRDRIGTVLKSAKLKEEVFAPYFSIASLVIAQLRHHYDIQTPIGKIYPALYEHFIKHPSDLIDEDKKRAIIRDIVLCGLRDGSQTPAKAVQVDEELLAHLITEASI